MAETGFRWGEAIALLVDLFKISAGAAVGTATTAAVGLSLKALQTITSVTSEKLGGVEDPSCGSARLIQVGGLLLCTSR
ncbi:hypothetical protein ACIBCM_13280 [Streptomyces sp. NPDC051018]|uniref:hypothetical protein n=1 Tax=Streptomyces sp. NPDC051018 TaxID=3365639 RepID=UPI003799152E